MSKLAKAKALADEWADQKQMADEQAALNSYFRHATPHHLIAMWTSGKNVKGKLLTQWETQALVEAWCRVFGDLPPDEFCEEVTAEPPPPPTPELPADDTMLRTADVLRLIGVSLSTLKRMVLAQRFPKPMRLSPHRIGWPARDVKVWLDAAEDARAKGRL